jgi:hypothetical protein
VQYYSRNSRGTWMLSAVAGSRSRRRVATLTAVPHSAPATTSLGQCALEQEFLVMLR